MHALNTSLPHSSQSTENSPAPRSRGLRQRRERLARVAGPIRTRPGNRRCPTTQPLDATDWCCHAHDCCYRKLSSPRCSPKLVTYKYSTRSSQITCGSGTWCQRQSCECDKRAAECFQRTARTYRNSYKNYPNLLCKGPTPSC
ncbi:PREDICTED: basic phospholipase A2 F16-like [Phaethon lepturus]|uniref:basic phospholipase A2 F16-like n=1 Tax=Phaethon lepturus TaxID=97097 RepID=UPI0005308FE6|nr:PREDICTED: basic phospholipase A2 F16-like [Phaethon lepturus]